MVTILLFQVTKAENEEGRLVAEEQLQVEIFIIIIAIIVIIIMNHHDDHHH